MIIYSVGYLLVVLVIASIISSRRQVKLRTAFSFTLCIPVMIIGYCILTPIYCYEFVRECWTRFEYKHTGILRNVKR